MDDIGCAEIQQAVLQRKTQKLPMKESEAYQAIATAAIETNIRRGGNGMHVEMHSRTIKNVFKKMELTREKGQTITTARHREGKDIRNMVSMAAMNCALASGKPAIMIGNFDATQFIISGTNDELLVNWKPEDVDEDDNEARDEPLTLVENSMLSHAIKWFMLCNANGQLGKDVFLLADRDMTEDEFTCEDIQSLSNNNQMGASGWLCFTKTRCGNAAFFKWYISTVVVEFVKYCRNLLPLDEQSERFYLVADGEEVQIQPLENDEVNNILSEALIDFGKGPASCTGTVSNACDRSSMFKSAKKVLRNQKEAKKLNYQDDALENLLIASILKLHPKITTAKRLFLSKGIVKVVRGINQVNSFSIVQDGFSRIGVHPLSAKKCIQCCDSATLDNYSNEVIEDIVSKVPALAEIFLQTGQITEGQMDAANIPRIVNDDRRTLEKDKRCQSHQRAVWLNSVEARIRRQEYMEAKKKKPNQQLPISGNDAQSAARSVSSKPKRKPNRSQEEIAAERAERDARRLLRNQAQTAARHLDDTSSV